MADAIFGLPINGLDNFEAPRALENWNGFPVPLVAHDIAVQIAEMVGDPPPDPYEGLQPYGGLCWKVGVEVDEVRQALLEALQGAGLTASWEFPGWLSIDAPDGSGDAWAFGTANGYWAGDRTSVDGEHRYTVRLRVHHDSGDVDALAVAIVAALETRRCHECGEAMDKQRDGAIAEPVMNPRTGAIERRIRPAVYWSCGTCESCEEVARG